MSLYFLPTKLALAMKKLRFNEEVLGEYDDADFNTVYVRQRLSEVRYDYQIKIAYSQAFRWFIEECAMSYLICQDTNQKYYYQVGCDDISKTFETYKEAEEGCLTEMIEEVNIK